MLPPLPKPSCTPLPPPPVLLRPKSNVPRLSRKKSRFSGNCSWKRVRFSCCSSTSTCAKSVRTVRSAVRLAVMPYFRSPPQPAPTSLFTGGRTIRSAGVVGGQVRLHLDVRARRRQVEADERGRLRNAKHAVRSAIRRRQRRQVRPFVLAPDRAAQLNAPHLVLTRHVAHRLERNRHLGGPAAVEAAGVHVPHRIPVGVRIALVGDQLIGEAAERIGVEVVAVAAIVKRVEQHAEHVVLAQLVGVAPQLVGDPLARRRRVVELRARCR